MEVIGSEKETDVNWRSLSNDNLETMPFLDMEVEEHRNG